MTTTTTYTTTAARIAALFGDDGQCYVAVVGRIEDVCHEAAAGRRPDVQNRGTDSESRRYDFADGSSIVVGASAWDVGLPGGCHCWAGAGHDGCESKRP